MAPRGGGRFNISNEYSRRMVHQWRSQEASILVGTNTAFFDDPELTNRYWHGPSPIRLIVDMELRLPSSLKLFNKEVKTIVFNRLQHEESGNPVYYQLTTDVSLVHQVVHALYQLKIQSVLVEGGARLLQSFIDEDMWDELRIITNEQMIMPEGIAAPFFEKAYKISTTHLTSDRLDVYKHISTA
jgi:diaminohydroxyphosphoribosylaminopyrimidine deaminase/5-amino-6-(5-phosphoribosylamino)uracil reductase